MIVEMKLDFEEINILYRLLEKRIEEIENSSMDAKDKDYILKDYTKLLKKLREKRNLASEYDDV